MMMGVLLGGCSGSPSANDGEASGSTPAAMVAGEVEGTPRIAWADTVHDLGNVPQGAKAYYSFKFRNVGDAPLVIGNVSTSCGCTVSDYPHQPVAPGDSAAIEVRFDSKGRRGRFAKTITVITNADPPRHVLKITGNVVNL